MSHTISSKALEPAAEETGTFARDLILSEAQMFDLIFSLLDSLQDKEQSIICHFIWVEFNGFELRFLIFTDERADLFDTRIKDVIVWVVDFVHSP